jgi:uncharacterized protein YjbI with pentapeptide repeats
MILPSEAIVRPRGICPDTGETLPLDELIEGYIASHDAGAIEIVGGPGSGKTATLKRLHQTLSPGKPIMYLDAPELKEVASIKAFRLVVYTTGRSMHQVADVSFALCGWGEDEWIEYLLATHSDRCQSVLVRIRGQGESQLLGGNPELSRIVLDSLAANESLTGVRAAMHAEVAKWRWQLGGEKIARDYALERLKGTPDSDFRHVKWQELGVDRRRLRLMRHRPMQIILAAASLRNSLELGQFATFRRLPLNLLGDVANVVADSPKAVSNLYAMLSAKDWKLQSIAASILHVADIGWTPAAGPLPSLAMAQLVRADWRGLNRSGLCLNHANLAGANLTNATLLDASAVGCRLPRASMRGADLTAIFLRRADLRGADFSNSNLKRADLQNADCSATKFCSADLRGADFRGASVDGADFSRANLTVAMLSGLDLRSANFSGADFTGATLVRCDLEGTRLRRAEFVQADLSHASLTGSVMSRGNFQFACLAGARLAEIQWERADLRNADLRKCTFHLGSTRSGLVGSPLACEGSRTGFYTDDFEEQGFKSPEEIRKANLRGADLRGAKIDGVDFYLVDLRNAKYTDAQADHFRRCGAILSKRRGS